MRSWTFVAIVPAVLAGCSRSSSTSANSATKMSASSHASAKAEFAPGQAPHSAHHVVKLDEKDIVAASIEMKIDDLPAHGMVFAALQLTWPGAWAHGGLQRVSGVQKANWGGLTYAHNYDVQGHELETMELIQNGPMRVAPVDWETKRWVRYRVARIGKETLPEGEYAPLDGPKVHAPARTMWRWDFVIEDEITHAEVYHASLHTKEPLATGLTYWVETGYGVTCGDSIHVHFKNLAVKSLAHGDAATILEMHKSLAQSTCPTSATSDIMVEDAASHATVTTFGAPRAPESADKQRIF